MPQPSAFFDPPKGVSSEKGILTSEVMPTFIRPAEGRKDCKKVVAGWILKGLLCFMLGALGAAAYHAIYMSYYNCVVIDIQDDFDKRIEPPEQFHTLPDVIQKEDDIDLDIDPSLAESTTESDVITQVKFSQQEQKEARQNEMIVMPLHCKITKADGLGTGTTILISGKAQKDATQIDVVFENPHGIYTFYMQLRWRPFENSVFFTTQAERYSWKTTNDDYRWPSPLENEKGGLFNIMLKTRPDDMEVTIKNSTGVDTVYYYKHKEGFDQADSKVAILSGNVESVSECKIL